MAEPIPVLVSAKGEYAMYGAVVWYAMTYVVPAAIGTGDEKLAVCHPLAVSLLKVAVARS